mmetsp:Transcript_102127/g.284357  ORF Transcript_102127/g.284357 Transcript_102127/m.284357 type:complete len:473 (-) Transcript_102127:201-1619(-)
MATASALPLKKLRVMNVLHEGEFGKLCGNAESLGWMRDDAERMVVYDATSVKRAEWFQGQLRVLCETEGGDGAEVFALAGFANEDFDNIWRYFEQTCGIHVKKHRAVTVLDVDDFDRAQRGLEDAADRVDEAARGSPLKKGRELDLLKRVENLRDGLDEAVSGDKQALNRIFSSNGCERIGRLRLVLDTVQLETYQKDPRWLHLRNMCATIESVLQDMGTFRQWRPPEGREHELMLRRMMLRELELAQGRGVADESKDEQQQQQQQPGEGGPSPMEQPSEDIPPTRGLPTRPLNFEPYGAVHPVYGIQPPTVAPVSEPAPVPSPHEALPPAPPGGRGQVHRRPSPEEPEDDSDSGEDQWLMDPKGQLQRAHPGSLLEGWVWKRSRFLRRWRRRWLVLMPRNLMSFKGRGGSTVPTEAISAATVLRVYSAESELLQGRSLGVATPNRTYFIVCDTEAQKEAWIRAINKELVAR